MQVIKVDPHSLKENPDDAGRSKSSPQSDALLPSVFQSPVISLEVDGGIGYITQAGHRRVFVFPPEMMDHYLSPGSNSAPACYVERRLRRGSVASNDTYESVRLIHIADNTRRIVTGFGELPSAHGSTR
nr:hypothetical protein [Rhizobium laguerreae]